MEFTPEELENEIWADVEGYDHECQISNLGRFRRLTHFHKSLIGEITTGSFDERGYLKIGLTKNGKKGRKKIHRLVGKYFVEGYSEELTINHKDFIKSNNRASNLEMMTNAENALDYVTKVRKEKSSSRILGIGFHKGINKWTTRVTIDGKRCSLGSYDSEQEAIKAIEDYKKGILKIRIGKGKRKQNETNE